ncbi:junctional protein associated with coronary artery disease isoform X1 [Chiloscyllium plagiosum]|uniref:junctional protein associated with coronary artery disease isoform X1 n=1 Tax=Chiloscyllium plagiosum TaxID=36176 RepID=UPI001CB7ED46|nr:junctional protein associated with coronary artery disease isoform X1 [Chiloscyllium plagiosum]XP_043546503.1 junctional protein associated with coronary artery disease isoform X1 [Chiloscyllium plagiosum]XP_043546504.1 junctional protein associated with coronary artery disease isoform X1 [Chiloscyllium plagiosum]XP_043546506.1 junctional protein associated with coronary artery disease isoform X1 [Chiloscyllium plagiosum]XP_043546507.1 junctional protein associated with coronary artery disea
MFSVEDLLISHGYQPPKKSSKDKPLPSDENTYTSCRCEGRENKPSHGTVNGYETDTGAYSASRHTRSLEGSYSDSEGRDRSARRQAGVSCCADVQRLPTSATREAWLNSGPLLPSSSRPKPGKDVTYWRRRGQDFSVLLDYTNRGDSGCKGNNVTKDLNNPKAEQQGKCSQDVRLKNMQHKPEVTRMNEQKGWMSECQSVTVKEMVEDKWRMPEDRKCQSLGTEEWKASLGRQLSDGDGNKLKQGILPHVVDGEELKREGLPYIKKEKSQSLPRVIPESNSKEFQTGLYYVDMPGFDRNRVENQFLKDDLVLQDNGSYCHPKSSTKWTENFRPCAQLPKTKLTRPLKPPSYELYQQIRRSSEMIPNLHLHGETDGQVAPFANDSEASVDTNCCLQAPAGSSLEPPVYVPPPSYKAPPQQNAGKKCFEKVPACDSTSQPFQSVDTVTDQSHWCLDNQESDHAQQKHISHDSGTKQHLQTKSVSDDVGKNIPHKRQPYSSSHNGYTDDQKAFVKYIPFNDPRLRHITIVQSEKQNSEAKHKYEPWKAKDNVVDGNKTFGPSDHCSAFSVPSGSYYSTQAGLRPITDTMTSNKWFVASKSEIENGTKSERCSKPYLDNQFDTSFKCNSGVLSTLNHPVSYPHSNANSKAESHVHQDTVETITQVKKWEPDSQSFEAQEKKHSKRRISETIFCLVSVPVKTCEEESNEDVFVNDVRNGSIDTILNDSTGNLTEQSFLSMSSSDLELQALTGNMISENGLKRPEPWNEVSNRRTVSYNFNQHRELTASGSWPGDQYRDQETQTSFIKGPRTTRSFTGAMKNIRTRSQIQSQNDSEPECSTLMQGDKRNAEVTAINDQKRKLKNCSINGQANLYPSTGSAFSKAAPKQHQVKHISSHQSHVHGASRCSQKESGGGSVVDQLKKSRAVSQTSSSSGREAVGFGQFLLKPVSRRPWDAISELESFNKEIQEQEDRNVQGLQKEVEDSELSANQSVHPDNDVSDNQTYQTPELYVSEKSSVKLIKPKEKKDSGSDKSCSNYTNFTPDIQDRSKRSAVNNKLSSQSINQFQKPINKRTTDTKSSTILNVFTTKNAYFSKLKNENNLEDTKSKRQCININGVRTPMCQLIEERTESTNDPDTSNKVMVPDTKAQPARETECNDSIGKMFPQFDNDQGHSEPILNSLNCHKSTKPKTDNLYDLLEQKPVEGISKTESLEERAARILGIDVAGEALISPVKKTSHQNTGENETKPPSDVELGYNGNHFVADRKNASVGQTGHIEEKSLESNKLSEWKQNPLYGSSSGNNLHENKLLKQLAESNKESGKRAIINEFFHGPFKEFYNWTDANCCLSAESKAVSVPGADRKGRNSSEKIDSLQGKLSSSPLNRTALNRLARMKEVDSVSRIRRLSIKSTGSGDDFDEEKCRTERGEEEADYMLARQEELCTARKRVISLDQDLEPIASSMSADSEHRQVAGEHKSLQCGGEGFPCWSAHEKAQSSKSDVYDPSKVETV